MTPGERFVQALVAKDEELMKAVLRQDVDFKALTPGRCWESDSAAQVVDEIVLGTWFAPSDEIAGLEAVETSLVGERYRVAYRLRVRNDGGLFVVEQQAYYDTEGERISWLRILCAGYQRVSDVAAP